MPVPIKSRHVIFNRLIFATMTVVYFTHSHENTVHLLDDILRVSSVKRSGAKLQ